MRHGDYAATFGEDAFLDALDTAGGTAARMAQAERLENLVVACERAIVRKDARVAAAACRAAWVVWAAKGPSAVAVALAQRVLGLATLDDGDRGRVERVAGLAQRMSGKPGLAEAHLLEALALFRAVGEVWGEASVLGNLGLLFMERGRMDEAGKAQEQALALHRSVRHRKGEGIALGNLAVLHRRIGQGARAAQECEDALAIHREVGNRREEGVALGNLGLLCAERDRLDAAKLHFEAALAIHREVGNRRSEGVMLGNLGEQALEQGQLHDARRSLSAALTIHREIGNRRFEGVMLGALGLLAAREGAHEEALGHLQQGEDVLRGVGDQLELGRLLCARAEAAHLAGDFEGATVAISEAGWLAGAVGATPNTELGKMLARVTALVG